MVISQFPFPTMFRWLALSLLWLCFRLRAYPSSLSEIVGLNLRSQSSPKKYLHDRFMSRENFFKRSVISYLSRISYPLCRDLVKSVSRHFTYELAMSVRYRIFQWLGLVIPNEPRIIFQFFIFLGGKIKYRISYLMIQHAIVWSI